MLARIQARARRLSVQQAGWHAQSAGFFEGGFLAMQNRVNKPP